VQLSATTTVNTHWTLTASAGFIRGGDVVRRQFAGATLFVAGMDSVVRFP
jgi:hypothetical protein